jgi:hypothetical protein
MAAIQGWLVGQPGGKDYCHECRKKLAATEDGRRQSGLGLADNGNELLDSP